MSFYQDRILPHLVRLAMQNRRLVPYRERVTSAARGRVLEIGIGSGLNLPFYPPQVRQILGLEPAPRMLAMARGTARGRTPEVTLVEGSAEAIALADHSVDTVLTSWTLCTIPDVSRALAEMRRVLAPGGQLLFVEHGRSPDAGVCRWQRRLTPLWKRIGGGCHLDRAVIELIEAAGFTVEELDTGYMRGPRPMSFMYQGRARVS